MPVLGDIARLQQVVGNLLDNASKYSDAGTAIELALTADGGEAVLRVRDHGVGMTSEEVQHVFDRFWRADPARARTTGGTGLGLAISLEDAHLHGGWLEAWGRPARGASFRLTLPRRAGIRLQSSPLPLVSEVTVERGAAVIRPRRGPRGRGARIAEHLKLHGHKMRMSSGELLAMLRDEPDEIGPR